MQKKIIKYFILLFIILVIGGVILMFQAKRENRLGANNFSSELTDKIKEKYLIDGLSFSKPGKTINDVSLSIGDSKSDKFIPEINFSRWDEVSLKLLYDPSRIKNRNIIKDALGAYEEDVNFNDNKIIYSDGLNEVHYYSLESSDDNPEGGYEIEYVLDDKPDNNRLIFDFYFNDLVFYKQPELTDFEKSGGFYRPENVVGSFAVYYADKISSLRSVNEKSFKTGKFMHIYFPYIMDADGNKVRADDFNIEVSDGVGKIIIDLPEDFMLNAKYPVTVDPTFGFTSAGASGGEIAYEYNNAGVSIHRAGNALDDSTILVYSNAGNQYFRAPDGVTSIIVSCWGGGGGGGDGTSCGGAGGGGGAFASGTVTVVPGTIYPIVVGAGGAGPGSATGASGTDGATSTFATTTIIAEGGRGGGGCNSTDATAGRGGSSSYSVGTVKYSGGNGGNGTNSGDTGGGGGGAGGKDGNGVNALAGNGTIGGQGGYGDNYLGGASGTPGSVSNGGSGGTSILGGGGGGGGDDGYRGGSGGVTGGGGGGGENNGNSGGAGRCEIVISGVLPTISGDAVSISAYVMRSTGGGYTDPVVDMKYFLNETNSVASGQHGLVLSSEELIDDTIDSSQWITLDITGTTSFSLTKPFLNITADATSTDSTGVETSFRLAYDSSSQNGADETYSTSATYASPEVPWVTALSTRSYYSIYMTYNEASTSSAPVSSTRHRYRSFIIQ